jgi:hypothetical protein
MQFIPKRSMSLTDTSLLEIAKLDSKLRHALQTYLFNTRGDHFQFRLIFIYKNNQTKIL